MFTGVLSPIPPLVSPRFFKFLSEFFSRVLLSERLEQARRAWTQTEKAENN